VDVIFAGAIATNPTELLAGPVFNDLIAEMKSKYQIIIIDCPPVLPIADAAVICKVVDGCVIVVHAGKTKAKAFLATVDAVSVAVPEIFGVIINKIPNNRESEDYGYLSGYNRYYKGTYGYILKKRGYTPYGPYSPKEILSIEKKSDRAKNEMTSESLGFKAIWTFVKFKKKNIKGGEKISHSKILSTSTSVDDEVSKWLNELEIKSNTKFASNKKDDRQKKNTRANYGGQ
jgi:hypothetical protein